MDSKAGQVGQDPSPLLDDRLVTFHQTRPAKADRDVDSGWADERSSLSRTEGL